VSANEDCDTTQEAPPQWVIHAMSEPDTAEMIERHIDFVDDAGRSVHCPMPFVRHYLRRDDDALPQIVAVATLPIVSADGFLIHADGLDRKRGMLDMFAAIRERCARIMREGGAIPETS